MNKILGDELKVLGTACLCVMLVSQAVRGESPGKDRLAAMGSAVSRYVSRVREKLSAEVAPSSRKNRSEPRVRRTHVPVRSVMVSQLPPSIQPVECSLQDMLEHRASANGNDRSGLCPQHAAGSAPYGVCRSPSLCEWIFGVRACRGWGLRDVKRRLAAKLAYFSPSGCGGAGCPPVGDYHIIYAVQPDYFDARDSQIFAAPGTGVPMAVPLAPNVHYVWNYSDGIPSSRLTPISRTVPPSRVDR